MRARRSRSGLHRAETVLLLLAVCLAVFVFSYRIRTSILHRQAIPGTLSVTVRKGDTLWGLAKEHGDPEEYILRRVYAIRRANALAPGDVLREGQQLRIPVGRNSTASDNPRYACAE